MKTALNTPAVSASGEAYYIGDDPACLYLMGALGRSEDNAFLDEDLQSNAQGYARDGLAALQKRFPGVASRLNQSYELPDGSEWVPAEDDLVLYALARFGRLQSRGNVMAATPAAPSFNAADAAAAERQIKRLMKENPPGTRGYVDPRFAARIAAASQGCLSRPGRRQGKQDDMSVMVVDHPDRPPEVELTEELRRSGWTERSLREYHEGRDRERRVYAEFYKPRRVIRVQNTASL